LASFEEFRKLELAHFVLCGEKIATKARRHKEKRCQTSDIGCQNKEPTFGGCNFLSGFLRHFDFAQHRQAQDRKIRSFDYAQDGSKNGEHRRTIEFGKSGIVFF